MEKPSHSLFNQPGLSGYETHRSTRLAGSRGAVRNTETRVVQPESTAAKPEKLPAGTVLEHDQINAVATYSLDDLESLRAHLAEVDEAEKHDAITDAVNTMLPNLDDQEQGYNARYRHRHELADALAVDDEKFDKLATKWEKREYRERGIPTPAKLEKRQARQEAKNAKTADRLSTQSKRSELREISKFKNGTVVPNLANEGWTQDELNDAYTGYFERTSGNKIKEAGGVQDDPNDLSAYTEAARLAARKTIDAKTDAKAFTDPTEAKAYRVQLAKDIFDYVSLDNDSRAVAAQNIGRYRELQSELAGKERLSSRVLSRAKRIGAAALSFFDKANEGFAAPAEDMIRGAGKLRERWNALAEKRAERRAEKTGQVVGQLELFDANGNITEDKAEKRRWRDIPLEAYTKFRSRNVARQHAKQERLAAMTPEERKAYNEREHKRGNITKVAILGGAAVTLAATIVAMRHGMYTGGSGNHSVAAQDTLGNHPTGGNVGGGHPIDELPVPKKPSVEIHTPVDTTPHFSAEAIRVDQGEGLYQTFDNLGVPAEKRHELLMKVGPKLVKMGEAYRDNDPKIGGYGLNGDGKLSTNALKYISDTAKTIR